MSLAQVTHAEATLLQLARCVVGAGPSSELARLLLVQASPPGTLGLTAAGLLQDTLARGVALALLKEGGWTREPTGRLWDGTLPPLHFTANVLALLQWALRMPLAQGDVAPLDLPKPLTPAEEVFVALLLERARGTAAEPRLTGQVVLRRAPLVQVMHAASLGRLGPIEVAPVTAAHFPLLRGLLDLLGDTWFSAELQKAQLTQPAVLSLVGRAQAAVGASLLDALDRAQQRPLARFLIDAAAAWLRSRRSASELVALDPESPLGARAEARREAAALWRLILRLEQWDQQHRMTRFIDDGYEAAQAMVRDWERLGPRGFRDAERLVAELEALPT